MTFPERDDVLSVAGIVDVERQKRAESPKIATIIIPARVATALGPNSVEIENHLDRTPVAIAKVHNSVLGISRAANRASEMRYVTHGGPLRVDFRNGSARSYPSGDPPAKRVVPLEIAEPKTKRSFAVRIAPTTNEFEPCEERLRCISNEDDPCFEQVFSVFSD